MLYKLMLPVVGLITLMSSFNLNGAKIKNVDIPDKCKIIVVKNDETKPEFDMPAIGKESEADLSNRKRIVVQCETYKGEGQATAVCDVPVGELIEILTIRNVVDQYGDYPGCKAN
tara:strand:- start:1738 stop:2082 length:345 start_codon:yes stop_codon:yes gene_type:complete